MFLIFQWHLKLSSNIYAMQKLKLFLSGNNNFSLFFHRQTILISVNQIILMPYSSDSVLFLSITELQQQVVLLYQIHFGQSSLIVCAKHFVLLISYYHILCIPYYLIILHISLLLLLVFYTQYKQVSDFQIYFLRFG